MVDGSMEGQIEEAIDHEGKTWEMQAWYDDQSVKLDEEWNLKSRRMTTAASGPANQG